METTSITLATFIGMETRILHGLIMLILSTYLCHQHPLWQQILLEDPFGIRSGSNKSPKFTEQGQHLSSTPNVVISLVLLIFPRQVPDSCISAMALPTAASLPYPDIQRVKRRQSTPLPCLDRSKSMHTLHHHYSTHSSSSPFLSIHNHVKHLY